MDVVNYLVIKLGSTPKNPLTLLCHQILGCSETLVLCIWLFFFFLNLQSQIVSCLCELKWKPGVGGADWKDRQLWLHNFRWLEGWSSESFKYWRLSSCLTSSSRTQSARLNRWKSLQDLLSGNAMFCSEVHFIWYIFAYLKKKSLSLLVLPCLFC